MFGNFGLVLAILGYIWLLFATFGYFWLLARLLAPQPLDGSFEMEEVGHTEGVWGQLYHYISPSPDSR